MKRILALLLAFSVVFTSVFFNSNNVLVVKAADEESLLESAIEIALAAAGVWASGCNPAMIVSFVASLKEAGFNVYDYVTQDTEAGTTTISADFVNLVLQAYKQYKEENGEKFDGVMSPDENGYYHYDNVTAVKFMEPMSVDNMSISYTDINTQYPIAILVYSNQMVSSEPDGNRIMRIHTVIYNKYDDKFYSPYIDADSVAYGEDIYLTDFAQAMNGYGFVGTSNFVKKWLNTGETQTGSDFLGFGGTASYGGLPASYSLTVSSSSIPVYHSLSALKEGLRSGDFSGAWNYGKVPDGETPSYTGEYTGGDITVLTEKLEGIQDKIEELDGTGKSIEELLRELLEWLKLEGGGTGGADFTETNSWLAKIYAKVSQIFDKISETAGGVSDTVHAKIQETLDEIVEQLKKLKRWTAVDTVIDGVDAIGDWLSLLRDIVKDAESGVGSAVSAVSSALGETVDLASRKFPFSIPWDILFFVSVMSSEPQVPQFEIPFDIELSALDIRIDYTMQLDFSQFQWLSDLSRLILSLTYAAGLLKMTFRVTPAGKEE